MEQQNIAGNAVMDEQRVRCVLNKHLDPEMKLQEFGYCVKKPVPWIEINLPKKTQLGVLLDRKIRNFEDTDTNIIVEEKEFKTHLIVLQAYSEYFKTNVQNEYKFSRDEVTAKAFPIIYNWMIFRDPDSYKVIKRDNILELLRAALFLKIKNLEEQIWTVMDNPKIYSEHEAFFILVDAHRWKMNNIVSLMSERIIDFFIVLVTTSTFLELHIDVIVVLLQSSYLKVNCEQEVFLAGVRWLFHEWDARKKHAIEVMSCVRFGYIRPNVLVTMNLSKLSLEVYEVMSIPEVNKMRQEGLDHSIIFFANQRLPAKDHHILVQQLKMKAPLLRYYTNIHCEYETYNDFLCYLDNLRREVQKENNPTEADNVSQITDIYELE